MLHRKNVLYILPVMLSVTIVAMLWMRYWAGGFTFFDMGYHVHRIERVLQSEDVFGWLRSGHFQPILLFHAVLFSIFDRLGGVFILTVLQTTTLILAIILNFKYLKKNVEDSVDVALLSIIYILLPAIWFSFIGDYHVETLLFLLIPISIQSLKDRNAFLFLFCFVVLCLLKEVYPLVAAGLCVLGLFLPELSLRWKHWMFLGFVFGIAACYVEIEYLTVHIVNQYENTPNTIHTAYNRYGTSISEMLISLLTNPLLIVESAKVDHLYFLIKALGPYCFWFALQSPYFIPALFIMPVYLLSDSPHHLSYAYQYPAAIAPFFYYSFVEWYRQAANKKQLLFFICLALAFNVAFSPSWFGRIFWTSSSTFSCQAYLESYPEVVIPPFFLEKKEIAFVLQNTVLIPAVLEKENVSVFPHLIDDVSIDKVIVLAPQKDRFTIDSIDSGRYEKTLAFVRENSELILDNGVEVYYMKALP